MRAGVLLGSAAVPLMANGPQHIAVSGRRSRSGGAIAGGKREFRLAFDAIPEGWNQTMPNLFIAEIVFGTAP